jgi:hypothetical protein
MRRAQSKRTVIETKNKFDEQTSYTTCPLVTTTACHSGAHKLEASGGARASPIVLMSLLGVGARELLPAPIAFVNRRVLRMHALVVAVAIVLAGERITARTALETRGRRRRVLDSRPRRCRERRPVGVLKDTRSDERGRGDVDRRGLTVVVLLDRLFGLRLRLLHRVGLGRGRLLVPR